MSWELSYVSSLPRDRRPSVGFDCWRGGDFSLFLPVKTSSSIRWVPEALSFGVKQLGRDSNYPSPSGAKVKKDWSYNARRKQWLILGCSVNPLS
jgi:hypothetical protein